MIKPDNQHPDYIDYIPVWKKCRDAAAGQRAIKLGGETYLKALSGQIADRDKSAYDAYRDRGNYFNATGRTVDAMVGMVFRKPMTVEVPAAVEPWLLDVTLSDETLTDLAQSLLRETIVTDRSAILVEQPKASERPQTLAEKQSTATRPYLVVYKTESIINWKYKRVGNRYVLFSVWLSETYEDQEGKQQPQIRQLTIQKGFYQQIIWQRPNDKADWTAVDEITPTKSSAVITDIPFYPITSGKPTLEIGTPMIESLADINIAHYKNSADLENGAHIAGLPTAYITGVDDTGEDGQKTAIYLGSNTILTLPVDAKAGFLQCGSEGFATIEKLMDRKEQQMAALGARMLAPEKKQAEASETHEIKRGGESSVLSSICGTVERQLTAALQFASDWEGIAGEIKIELNRVFLPSTFNGAEAVNWMKVWQAGGISKEYLFYIYKDGEYLPDEATFEEMQAQIEAEGPALGTLADDPANDNGNQ